MAPKWPQVNNGPEHINEHATYLKEVCNQLQAVDRGRHNQVPWNIVRTYLDSTLVLIGKVLRQPALREMGTKTVKVVAAYQLKSGDIQIFTSTTAEAIKLKENVGWLGSLGEHAEVVVPTYGVIVHGVPTNSINMKDQKATIEQILADNHTVIPQAKISHVG
ncbi:unnamed protein product [Clonostachys rosea f. rosea IK726]|uniref:Uncharacterized protein n=1 Tax=Clonostachys rosea f. rosea IK726 TaxID=1349383 RepID=A0ACA9UBV3_BIOOC|nr:unnamed protein product [Clonostachys rosea f. rosea IK726]